MFCTQCGNPNGENAKFCKFCGNALNGFSNAVNQNVAHPDQQSPAPSYPPLPEMTLQQGGGVGYSHRINDPAFSKFVKNSNRYALIFAVVLAIIAVVGFTIAGEMSSDMDNPESMFIGLGIGGMFILIALFQVAGKKGAKTWDGQVVDKKSERKTRRRNSGDDDSYIEHYTEYKVSIRDTTGKTHTVRTSDNCSFYDYVQVGDHLRYHGGLNTYEKYDKSRDLYVFCNACGKKHPIIAETCEWCKCPLLK